MWCAAMSAWRWYPASVVGAWSPRSRRWASQRRRNSPVLCRCGSPTPRSSRSSAMRAAYALAAFWVAKLRFAVRDFPLTPGSRQRACQRIVPLRVITREVEAMGRDPFVAVGGAAGGRAEHRLAAVQLEPGGAIEAAAHGYLAPDGGDRGRYQVAGEC